MSCLEQLLDVRHKCLHNLIEERDLEGLLDKLLVADNATFYGDLVADTLVRIGYHVKPDLFETMISELIMKASDVEIRRTLVDHLADYDVDLTGPLYLAVVLAIDSEDTWECTGATFCLLRHLDQDYYESYKDITRDAHFDDERLQLILSCVEYMENRYPRG